jgi:hypothetical protein
MEKDHKVCNSHDVNFYFNALGRGPPPPEFLKKKNSLAKVVKKGRQFARMLPLISMAQEIYYVDQVLADILASTK